MRGLALSCCLLLLAAPAAAQDEPLTLADDPFEITDPMAAAPGAAELSIVGIYERARRGRSRGTAALQTEFEAGVLPRLALRFGQEGAYGNLQTRRRLDAADPGGDGGGGPAWGGATRLGALVQLTEGRGALPVIGVLGRVRAVYGPGKPVQEGDLVALFGKSVGRGERQVGLNLNLGWTAPFEPLPGERAGRYFVNASVGRAVSRDTVLVLTYVHEQQQRGERDFSLVQAGVRHRLGGGGPVLGFAVGAGLNRDSPAVQVGFAVQWGFGLGGFGLGGW
jgi:hypothetical protein